MRGRCLSLLKTVAALAAFGSMARATLGQGIPFHTPTAMPLPLAENGLRTFYQHLELRTLLRNGDGIPNPERLRMGVDAVAVVIQAGVTPHTILLVGAPYLHRRFERAGTTQTKSGLGDVTVMIRQDVLANDFVAGNRRLALFAGASVPTGDTGDDSNPLAPPLRLGLGSVNLTGQAVYSYVDRRFGMHGAVGYTAAAPGRLDVRLGDRFGYDLALGYRVAPATYRTLKDVTVAAYLELDGDVEQPSSQGGAPLSDTGGHLLFLSPGLQVLPVRNWALETSVQIPIVRRPHGTQLAPTWTLAIGARGVLYLLGR